MSANTCTLSGTIDVSYKGFRGGGGKNLTGATAGNSNGTGALTNTDYRWNSPITNASNLTGGAKGEGIAGTPAYYFDYGDTLPQHGTVEGYINGSMGRGAPANGGGGATDGAPVGAITKINIILAVVAVVMLETAERAAADGMALGRCKYLSFWWVWRRFLFTRIYTKNHLGRRWRRGFCQ